MKGWQPLAWLGSLFVFGIMLLRCFIESTKVVPLGEPCLKSRIGQAHCNVGVEIPAPEEEQVLKLSVTKDGYKNLNPYYVRTNLAAVTVSQIFEGLLCRNAEGEFQGACAETWDYDRETLTWTFKLRPTLKWNDGSPLTAHDFVRGIQAQFDPQSYPHQQIPQSFINLLKAWNLKGAIKVLKEGANLDTLGVFTPDGQTLKLQWAEPCAPGVCYDQFAAPNCVPLHPEYLKNTQNPEAHKKLVTNGPFQLESMDSSSGATFKKNPYFWDAENVQLERVEYIESEDEMASVQAWQEGEVDISEALEATEMQALTPNDYRFLSSYFSGSWLELQFNLKCPKLQDRRVRQAINLILDRDELEARFFLPSQAKLYGYLAPGFSNGLPFTRPEWSHWSQERRLNKAQQLMLEAGYHHDNPLKVKLSVARGNDNAILKGMVACFHRLEGIDLETEEYASVTFDERRVSGAFEMGLRFFYTTSFHPFWKYHRFYHGNFTSSNLIGFQNQSYDKAIEAFKAAITVEAKERAILALERTLWEEAPVIPLCARSAYRLVGPRVGGWEAAHRAPISASGNITCRYLFKKN